MPTLVPCLTLFSSNHSQKEQLHTKGRPFRGMSEEEVFTEVANLFRGQEDLLSEFGQFLPEAKRSLVSAKCQDPAHKMNGELESDKCVPYTDCGTVGRGTLFHMESEEYGPRLGEVGEGVLAQDQTALDFLSQQWLEACQRCLSHLFLFLLLLCFFFFFFFFSLKWFFETGFL